MSRSLDRNTMSKTLIITGGTRGIGAETARLAAKRGYNVAITFRTSEKAAEEVLQSITSLGVKALAIRADSASSNDIAQVFTQVNQLLGPITAVFNNAGITGPICKLQDLDDDALQSVLDTNIKGAFVVAREAIRHLSLSSGGQGGAIVNMSSRAGQLGGGGEWVHYAASKAAIDAMTIGLAKEVGPDGIRVNAVSPGLIDTDIHALAGDPGRLDRLVGQVPLGRVGTCADVANVVLSLLELEFNYVSGAIVPVSGGR
jgi:NAD(P)-dependent dehydrogenase (short-subunit alcohol dehydrogenase family)